MLEPAALAIPGSGPFESMPLPEAALASARAELGPDDPSAPASRPTRAGATGSARPHGALSPNPTAQMMAAETAPPGYCSRRFALPIGPAFTLRAQAPPGHSARANFHP